jgi:D-alanyl-D-alanine dipeptidase
VLGGALGAVGLVNYPTEWWHWSYGDRYWALTTGAPAALYGPKELGPA